MPIDTTRSSPYHPSGPQYFRLCRWHLTSLRPRGQNGYPNATLSGLVFCLTLFVVFVDTPVEAQSPQVTAPTSAEEAPDPFLAEIIRARILARLGLMEESLAKFRALLARRPGDRELREDYAETLVESGLAERARAELDAFLWDDPRSVRLRRLRARVDLMRGEPRRAAQRLEALSLDAPDAAGVTAELANALLQDGRWARALSLYGGVIERDPDNEDVRAAYREILATHASRIELIHNTLLQTSATHHTEEVAWKGWLGQRWWLRVGARHAIYTQDSVPGVDGFTEEVQTALALLGFQLGPRWTARAGLEEARREDTVRTTLRLGGAFDDGRATTASLGIAVRELLTNPVTAIPLRGTTDRLTADISRRLTDRLTVAGQYQRLRHRVSGDELGVEWELAGRAEVELLRGRLQLTLIPQLFFSEYTPSVGSPLRERVSFIRRQDIIASGVLMGLDLLPGVRAEIGSVGRRDLHRALTSWEVTGEGRWQIHPRVEFHLLYTRNTEGGTIGGKEESFTGGLTVLY